MPWQHSIAQRMIASQSSLGRGVTIRAALIAYGILNAVLYASLLPLWEGFDEPFHYGYVQTLSQQRTLPQLGKSTLSPEVWASLQVAPASLSVKRNLPWVTTFEDYFSKSPSERHQVRAQLEHLPRIGNRGADNYEAHQAPLAYLLLSVLDRTWASDSLLTRVWCLRMVCGISSAILTAVFLSLLARRLGFSRRVEARLIFTVLSLQMFYAATAHVANDWLAVPLMLLLFERLLAFQHTPRLRTALVLAITLTAALLTKAYFLAMIPLAFGAIVAFAAIRRIRWHAPVLSAGVILIGCGPWYVRNLRLYNNLSGLQETSGGADWNGIVAAATSLPWLQALRQLVFTSLWTGNNSFVRFSSNTLSMLLLGFLAAAALYVCLLIKRKSVPLAEGFLLAGCGLYAAALLYSCVISFWYSKGAALTASPWYALPIIPVVLLLLFCSFARFKRIGEAIGLWLVWWSAYVITISYWAKLIPLYAGYRGNRANVLPLLAWYRDQRAALLDVLSTTAMLDAGVIFGLLVALSLAALALSIALSASLPRALAAGTCSAVPAPGNLR
jgi:hypothetical protein